MNQRKPLRRALGLFIVCTLLFPLLTAAQCLENANIPIPVKRDFNFEIDIDKVAQESLSKQGVQATADGKLPDGVPDIPIPVEITQAVDISNDSNVQKYGNKLRHVRINSVIFSVEQNTVNVPLPTLEARMANIDGSDEQQVGSLRAIQPGETGDVDDLIKTETQKDTAGRYIVKFAFNVKVLANYILKAGMEVPKGKLSGKIKLDVTFSINPFK